MTWLWSAVLAGFGLAGLVMVGHGRRVGWWVTLVDQVFWVAYAVVTKQYPFLATSAAYAYVAVRGLRRRAMMNDRPPGPIPLPRQQHDRACERRNEHA